MNFFQWMIRCVPGVSTLLLLILLECSLQTGQRSYQLLIGRGVTRDLDQPAWRQICFIAYSIFLHFLALAFPLRLSWAAWIATRQILNEHEKSRAGLHGGLRKNDDKIDDPENMPSVTMAIILPSFKESIEILEDSLRMLASHEWARRKYDVFLAFEERDPNSSITAKQLVKMFSESFADIQFTLHPSGIPGESAGKSSNVSWAAKEIDRKYISREAGKDVLVTVMDSDTHLQDRYFALIGNRHQVNRKQGYAADTSLYVPPIIFDRNAHLVPRLVRVADCMWCGAGLSCFQRESGLNGIAIPTAVYTVPLALVRLVGGWDAGPNAIGEDMHMMLKCYFATLGHLNIESIASPASQCNISTDKEGFRGWLASHTARYNQGLRHMWGSLDTGYAITQWIKIDKPIPSNGQIPSTNEGSNSHPLRRPRKLSHSDSSMRPGGLNDLNNFEARRFTLRHGVVFLRLFEAHFLPTHLFLVITASAIHSSLTDPSNEHQYLGRALNLTAYMRTASFAIMTIYFVIFYEAYHKACVDSREEYMRRSGLCKDMQVGFSHRRRWSFDALLDYLIFPIAGMLFGSTPLLQATISHFWSEKLVYLVSAKPIRALADKIDLRSTRASEPLLMVDNTVT